MISVVEDTNYPFEDQVRFTLEAAAPVRMALWLRRPAWAAACHLDGVEGAEQGGWIVIAREWQGRTDFTLRLDVPVRAEPYPAGEIAVLRGPLQFVQPIAHRVHELPVETRPGRPDAELLADDRVPLETLPIVDTTHADLGFVAERVATDAPHLPWHASPLRLRTDGAILQPMGCAPLRRADFRAHRGRRGDAA